MSLIPIKLNKSNVNFSWKVTTKPSLEPVTNDEVKLYARIDGSSEDDLIDSFIQAVREATEKYIGRALITQSITASFDAWFSDKIELPRPPLQSVTEVRTVDEELTETPYDSGQYYVQTKQEPGSLVIKSGSTPPDNTDRYSGGYEIEFVAGYGDSPDDVPNAIKTGITMWVAEIYENRVPISEPPGIVKTILAPFIIINV
jgi:uncharacterized phiE125 gp8 family phage protein